MASPLQVSTAAIRAPYHRGDGRVVHVRQDSHGLQCLHLQTCMSSSGSRARPEAAAPGRWCCCCNLMAPLVATHAFRGVLSNCVLQTAPDQHTTPPTSICCTHAFGVTYHNPHWPRGRIVFVGDSDAQSVLRSSCCWLACTLRVLNDIVEDRSVECVLGRCT